jgi:hypothetical protein
MAADGLSRQSRAAPASACLESAWAHVIASGNAGWSDDGDEAQAVEAAGSDERVISNAP